MPKAGEDRRYLVIVNPVSRGGKAQEEGIWLLNRLKKAGVDYEFLFTERAGHAEEMVVKWAEDFDVVVSVSGDGTTNEIINGIMKVPSAELKLAMFPAGTADDFARNMGYDRKDKEQALRAILGDACRTIDLIRYDDRYAAVTWGLGVDSEIADGAYKWKRFRIPAYFYSGLRKCFFEERKKYHVRFDYEGQTFEDWVLISILCNAPLFGRYIKIHPDAKMNDGLLGLTIGREMPNVYGLVLFAFACLNGRHGFSRLVSYHQVRNMRVECKSDTYAQIDGEVYRFDAGKVINISVVPQALRVLVPAESLDSKKLPFVYREEPPEAVQLRLIPRREGVAEELEELSRRVKARVEKALEVRRWRPGREASRSSKEQGRQVALFGREREERSARRAAKRIKKEMRKLGDGGG
ncbi:MAG: diacylglycerol kinase family lipid kinase [Actinobacteria bacterium]|jgi:diacylglycerol kinase (ATP)|nr:MAG: diacylglycerol kinase family lipid kinase [Actinomycetota bacterium]